MLQNVEKKHSVPGDPYGRCDVRDAKAVVSCYDYALPPPVPKKVECDCASQNKTCALENHKASAYNYNLPTKGPCRNQTTGECFAYKSVLKSARPDVLTVGYCTEDRNDPLPR